VLKLKRALSTQLGDSPLTPAAELFWVLTRKSQRGP
jgi:hypothetical protein